MKHFKVFTDIGELLTLAPAAHKQARKILPQDLGIIRNAVLVTDGGKIRWIGEKKRLPKEFVKIQKQISLKGATVLPGFVECHTHLIFGGSRSKEFDLRNQGVSYQEISRQGGGIASTMRETKKASAASLKEIAQKRANEFVRQGVTTLEAKSGYGIDFATEKKILMAANQIANLRVLKTYLGAHTLLPQFRSSSEFVAHLIKNDLPKVRSLASRVDIFVESGFFSKSDGQNYLKAAKDLGFDLCVHADQLSLSGGSELAIEMKARSADHLIQVGAKEIAKLAKSDVTCTLLPASDLYMNCAYPPARALIDAGARVALATDFNPGTCPTQDLSLVGVLARIQMKMTLAEVIAAYTIGAAYALGLETQIGSLEIDKCADFIVLDSSYDELFYEVAKTPVRETWYGAKKVFAFN